MKHSVAVGVDGSQASGQALRWAVREARLRGARVVVLTAWTFPSLAMPSSIPHNVGTMLRDQASATLEGMLAALGEETQGVEIERLIVEGDPAVRLIELSNTAELLVVGSRGLGGFRELLLGSVSHHCATHAACPVAVIRREDPRERAEIQGPIVAGVDGSPSSLEALSWAAREARLPRSRPARGERLEHPVDLVRQRGASGGSGRGSASGGPGDRCEGDRGPGPRT